jgi:hypothetical protein
VCCMGVLLTWHVVLLSAVDVTLPALCYIGLLLTWHVVLLCHGLLSPVPRHSLMTCLTPACLSSTSRPSWTGWAQCSSSTPSGGHMDTCIVCCTMTPRSVDGSVPAGSHVRSACFPCKPVTSS